MKKIIFITVIIIFIPFLIVNFYKIDEKEEIKIKYMSTKKNKFSIYIYVVITIIGCVLACSSIIPNDYLKLVVVMGALGVGLYGIMKGLSTPSTTEETASPEK